ncbi:MAG TPA: TGS domain-containing protein, partial [Candidatus Saccharimonadales bacterium]
VENIDDVYDLIALRIIVDDTEACYKALGVIHTMYTPMVGRIKDYIARPKPNGYQSLHTTISTPTGQIVEFQVRTATMHEYAERGLAASFHYNEQKLTDAYRDGHIAAMPADLAWIRQLQEVAAQLKEGKEADVERLKVDLFGKRIFIHSPRGDIYDLPDGAYPLDYAYRIHSDLGHGAVGFKVNGKMVPFNRPLRHGDTVEVITKRTAKPKSDWLDLVITRHAREKLRARLKKG